MALVGTAIASDYRENVTEQEVTMLGVILTDASCWKRRASCLT